MSKLLKTKADDKAGKRASRNLRRNESRQSVKKYNKKTKANDKARKRASRNLRRDESRQRAKKYNKQQKCTQLNLKHAKHTASIIIPVDKLPRPTCGMRCRLQTCSHRWNSTKTHAMSNPDPPSFPIFVIPKT